MGSDDMDDLEKPLPVVIVEAIAWMYVMLAVLLFAFAIVIACRDGSESVSGILFVILFGLCLMSLPVGMAFSLRRGRRTWFLASNTIVMGLCLIGAVISFGDSMAALPVGLLALLLGIAPIVLLNLPSSSRWFNEMSGDDAPDHCGCAVIVVVGVLWLAFVGPCLSDLYFYKRRTLNALSHAMAMRGRELDESMRLNNLSPESGEDWIDASSCTNSTQFVQALCDKYKDGAEGRVSDLGPYTNIWCIAVNPPNDDRFPVLFTANIDPRELLCPQDEDQPLKLTCPKEWGGVCFKFCEKMGVVHYKNGVSQIVKWHRSPKQIFCSGIPKPGPDTYFLTPTGRVDFAERQGSAMAISMNLKLISIDKSDRCVVAEFLLENCSQRGVFVFGSKDALTTYFMKDGVWVLCSTANDVGNESAEERGLFVEKGNVLRVSGRIPQECLLAKWFLVVGIGTRSKDEMESTVASPIYSRDNESGDRVSFKMEMNSVFKGRLKAFIANE